MAYKLDKDKELTQQHLVRLEQMEDPGTVACLTMAAWGRRPSVAP